MISHLNSRGFALPTAARPVVWLLAMVTVHSTSVLAAQMHLGIAANNGILAILVMMLTVFMPLFIVIAVVVQMLRLAVIHREKRPSRALIAQTRAYFANRPAVYESGLCMGAIVLFVDSFSRFKGMIPQLSPFDWDMRLAAIDRALHGGVDPWQWMMPLMQHSIVIRALDFAYVIWFAVLYFAVFAALFLRANRKNRLGFLIAFVLTWGIGGNAIAACFSSAGPVFFEDIGLGGYFGALNAYLDSVNAAAPLASHLAKETVWNGYAAGGAVASISAFPSMHVASSALITLFAFSYARWAGWVMAAFTALILIGSVALAWHYAVDGYGGIAIAYVSWRAGQWIALRA
jgi:hypothetical protein